MRDNLEGFVLYLLVRDDGAVKVGMTSNLDRRLSSLARTHGGRFRVVRVWDRIGSWSDVLSLEKSVHKRLRRRFSPIKGREVYLVEIEEAIAVVLAVLGELKVAGR